MLPKVHFTKSLLHHITHATLLSVPEPFYLTFTLSDGLLGQLGIQYFAQGYFGTWAVG